VFVRCVKIIFVLASTFQKIGGKRYLWARRHPPINKKMAGNHTHRETPNSSPPPPPHQNHHLLPPSTQPWRLTNRYGQPRQGGDNTSCDDMDEDLVKNHPIRPVRPIVTELHLLISDCQHPVDECPFGLPWYTLVTTLQFFIRLSILVSHPSPLPANDIPSTRCPPFIGTYTVGSTAEAPATADPMVRPPPKRPSTQKAQSCQQLAHFGILYS
jgi:hypothetical protein